MRLFNLTLILVIFTTIAEVSTASCRTYYYDHDSSPHTALLYRVACENSFAVRKIPAYRIPNMIAPRINSRTNNPQHIKLPKPKLKQHCIIRNVYQLTMIQTLSHCMTTR